MARFTKSLQLFVLCSIFPLWPSRLHRQNNGDYGNESCFGVSTALQTLLCFDGSIYFRTLIKNFEFEPAYVGQTPQPTAAITMSMSQRVLRLQSLHRTLQNQRTICHFESVVFNDNSECHQAAGQVIHVVIGSASKIPWFIYVMYSAYDREQTGTGRVISSLMVLIHFGLCNGNEDDIYASRL